MINHSDIEQTVQLFFDLSEYRQYLTSYHVSETIFCNSHSEFFERSREVKQNILHNLYRQELKYLYAVHRQLHSNPEKSELCEYITEVINRICDVNDYSFDIIFNPKKSGCDEYIIALKYSSSIVFKWNEEKDHENVSTCMKDQLIRKIFPGYFSVKEKSNHPTTPVI